MKEYPDGRHPAEPHAALGKLLPPVSSGGKWGLRRRSSLIQKSSASQKISRYTIEAVPYPGRGVFFTIEFTVFNLYLTYI
jgi:hypothetical protein